MKIIIPIFTTLLFAFSANTQSSTEYLYGTITNKSGDSYTGFMRWANEEVFWHDLFNGNKISSHSSLVNKTEKSKSRWSDFDWNFTSIWDDKYKTTIHSFTGYFGDIKTLHIEGSDKVDLELKNGAIIKLKGGSNDIGTSVQLLDYELGVIKFSWNKIKRIDFFQAPEGLEPDFGRPLYGKVLTRRRKTYEGYIKWDKDERTSSDILHGESKLGSQKIPFTNIQSIVKKGNDGSEVIFKSSRSLSLYDSNDVDDGNRGIRVAMDIGIVDIDWDDFVSIDFFDNPDRGPSYNDFEKPDGLQAEVYTFDGSAHEGTIIYDIDEMWETEILEGNDDYVKYYIPFRNIHKVQPKNKSYSLIYLNEGDSLLLGDTHDVSSQNDGIIIQFDNTDDPIRVDWKDVDEIIFK